MIQTMVDYKKKLLSPQHFEGGKFFVAYFIKALYEDNHSLELHWKQVFGIAFKRLLRMLHQSAQYKSWLCDQFQFPANVHTGRQQAIVHPAVWLSPIWQSWVGLLAPHLGLTCLGCCGHL